MLQTETDREQIPKLGEKELIALDETRLANLGKLITGVIGGLGAAVIAFLGLNDSTFGEQGEPGLALLAAGLLMSASVLAWAIVAAADIRARGVATAANSALRGRANVTVAAPGEAGASAGLWAHIRGRETGDEHLVVDSRVEREGESDTRLFLLARHDETPRWVTESEIDHWDVKTAADSGA